MAGFTYPASSGGAAYDDTALAASVAAVAAAVPTTVTIQFGTYTAANGGNSGTIPLFDSGLFVNGDIWNVTGHVIMEHDTDIGIINFSGYWKKIGGSIVKSTTVATQYPILAGQALDPNTSTIYLVNGSCGINVNNFNASSYPVNISVYAELKFLN